ncbi:MAG: GNAT family N-acetyltransferase [Candidatus Gastranaerophilales bacterium]|nr:GNAT family N-acetyltransferase [Candidatus Gastranaerophilales bacterium]
MYPINFTANFINSTHITKFENNKITPCKVSFVELDTNCNKDMDALEKIAIKWGNDTYSALIYENSLIDFSECDDNSITNHTYVLTTQNSDFDKIDYKKILGAALFKETDNNNKLELLQTNPTYISKNNPKSKYKGIGTSILDSLKALSEGKAIECFSAEDAITFYQNNGFVHNDEYKSKNPQIWYG